MTPGLTRRATPSAHTSYEYDNYVADGGNHLPLLDYPLVTGHNDSSFGSGYFTRGNPTKVSRMVTSSSSVTTYSRYDVLGNVVSIKDGRGNISEFSYQDDFGDGSSPGFNSSGQSTFSLPTRLTTPPPNPGQPQQVSYSQYDFSTGLLTGFKDRNGLITQSLYDVMGKLVAEYTDSQQQPAGGTKYLTTDHLGSTRVVTGQNQSVVARYDYLPFGEEIGAGVGSRSTAMGYGGNDTTSRNSPQRSMTIHRAPRYLIHPINFSAITFTLQKK